MAEAAPVDAKEEARNYDALKKFWDSLNLNNDAWIDGKEWGKVVGARLADFQVFFPGETVEEVGKNFNLVDVNDDDKITWLEFVAASDLGELRKLFASMDKNDDGKVSSKEWGQNLVKHFDSLKGLFGGRTMQEVGKFFNKFNLDGGKENEERDAAGEEVLSWDEFHQAWFNTQVAPETVELKKIWDMFDKNDDGEVDSKEWGKYISVQENMQKILDVFGNKNNLATLKDCGKFFNVIDADNNKSISWVELTKAFSKAQDVLALKSIFLEMDKDGSGFVDSKEWGRQLNAFKDRLGEIFMGMKLKDLGKMFNDMDTNEDDKISWDEISAQAWRCQDAAEEKSELENLRAADCVNEESREQMAELFAKKKKTDILKASIEKAKEDEA